MASHTGESKDSRYDRDAINTAPKNSSEKTRSVIQLSRFVENLDAAESIQRTADYASNPRTYLESNLGNAALTARQHLLHIPSTNEVNRDFYGTGGTHKQNFETHVANLVGKEHGHFFITGVQAQLAAMKIHSDRASSNLVAWHVTSHLEVAEQSAYNQLYGLERILLGSDPDALPTVDEIKEVLSLPEADRPAAILLEIPGRELGCQTYSFSDLQEISSACREAGVSFHMDGARIWEIEPFYQQNYGKSFSDLGALFDSIYVSFYKGLRGSTGAMLLAPDAAFIDEAKKWQRRAGGNMFQSTYEVIDCERGFNENIGTFHSKWKKMVEVVEAVAAATSKFTVPDGEGKEERLVEFWPQKPTCCQIRTALRGFTADELTAARDMVEKKIGVRVFERMFKDPRQRRKEVAAEKENSANEEKTAQAEVPKTTTVESTEDEKRWMIEWMVLKGTLTVETKLFVDAYVLLCEELLAARRS